MSDRLSLLIKKFRDAKGWSQIELAQKAGVGSGTIGEIESGKRKSSMKTLSKIAAALDLTQEQKLSIELAFIDKDIEIKKDIEVFNQFKDPIKMMTIPVFESVAAGIGYIAEAEPIDYINIPEISGECVAIKVNGDSMESTFFSGDLVVLKKDVEVSLGEIGVFLNKSTGEAVVKRLKKKNGVYVLESDNHIFKDIEIKTSEIVCCGKVVNFIKKDLRKKNNPLLEKIESLDPKQQEIIEMMINGLLLKK
ncbi:MAG: LexA family transcriptional regulator [Cetobacterium sp.]|uniref:LexA family protein n=1 Tax=Cetobacterium sp. TaxID=2071632 RepID=UPI002FC6D94D